MLRATEVLPRGHWDRNGEADTIELPHDGRYRRRIAMRGDKDTVFMLDLGQSVMLRDGDGLKLQDGRIVRVIAAAEPVAEIAADPVSLARIAWHLGNSHVPAQMLPDRIRIARDAELERRIGKSGVKVIHTEAPFEPEGGAAAAEATQAHGHHHDHGHDHAHHHAHEHGESCGCGHDHTHEHGDHHRGHAHKR